MASAVTAGQVTQLHFQEHLQTAVSQICQASPVPPSSSISEIQSPPRLGSSMCKSELTVPPNPHVPSQPVMVEDLSPMCHTHDEELLTMKSHWCHPLGHLEGRTWMNLTHTTFLGHNYACPTLRRSHTEQTMKSDILPKCTHQKWEDSPWSPHRSRWFCISGESPSFTPSLTRLCSYFSGVCSLLGQLYMVLGIFIKQRRQPPCSPHSVSDK